MKRVFFILGISLLIMSSFDAKGEDDYFSFPELEKYVGTWQWQSKDSVFTIILTKVVVTVERRDDFTPGFSLDALVGWHELSVGGEVIQSTMHLQTEELDYSAGSIKCLWDKDYNRVRVTSFKDIIAGRSAGNGYLEFNDDKNLVLNVTPLRNLFDRNAPKYSLPRNVVLKKIE